MNHSPAAWTWVLPLALPLLAAMPAQAETSPYSLGLKLAVAQDSNALRSETAATSDTLTTASVVLGLDQPIGRDRLHAAGQFDVNRFRTLSVLDNNSYSLSGGLDWTAANLWAGEFGADTSTQLLRYDLGVVGGFADRNLERNSHAYFRARRGVVTRWTFEGGLEAFDRSDSAAAFNYRDLRHWMVNAGLRFQKSPDLSLKGLLRHTGGTYPNGEYIGATAADTYTRDDVEGSLLWQASGASQIDARLALSRENHAQANVRSFSLWSGSLKWLWQPTGKLSFSTGLTRDSDTGSYDLNPNLATSQYNNARLRTALDLTGTWALSSKVQLTAGYSRAYRNLDATLVALGASATGSDTSSLASLGLVYQPRQAWQMGCSVSHENRSTSGNVQGISYPYTDRTVGCYGLLMLR